MKRLLIACVLACGLSAALGASFFSFEQITIDATSGGKGFTALKITPLSLPPMTQATCRARLAEMSFLVTDPAATAVTASVGQLLEVGDWVVLTSREEILNFRAIRTGAVSGQLDCTYKAAN